jgi:hypothetical protein
VSAVIAIYRIGVRLFLEKRAALYSTLCYLFSAQAYRSAQNIRTYALLGLLSAVSTLLFACLLVKERESRRDWIAYSAINAIGLFTHLWYAFVLVGQLAAVLLWRRPRLKACLIAMALSTMPFLVLWGPAFWQQLHSRETDWFPPFGPQLLLHVILDFYGGRLAILFLVACALLIGPTRLRVRLVGQTLDRVLMTCFTVSLVLPVIISVFKPIYYPGRYTIIALPPLALLLGRALARYARQPWLATLCLAMLLGAAVNQIKPDSRPAREPGG